MCGSHRFTLKITSMPARIIDKVTPALTSDTCRLRVIPSLLQQDVPFRRTFGGRKHIKSARINASSRLLRSPAVNSPWHRDERLSALRTSCFMQKLRARPGIPSSSSSSTVADIRPRPLRAARRFRRGIPLRARARAIACVSDHCPSAKDRYASVANARARCIYTSSTARRHPRAVTRHNAIRDAHLA